MSRQTPDRFETRARVGGDGAVHAAEVVRGQVGRSWTRLLCGRPSGGLQAAPVDLVDCPECMAAQVHAE